MAITIAKAKITTAAATRTHPQTGIVGTSSLLLGGIPGDFLRKRQFILD
jgi:hypothetical protein